MTEQTPTPQNIRRRTALIRVLVLVLVVGVMYGLAAWFGVLEHLTRENIQGWMTEAGWWGIALFVVAFVVGNLLHVPSNAFLAASVLAFGLWQGWALGWATNVLSLAVSFVFVRLVGGRALDAVERPWVRKAMMRMDERPIRTVALLRVVLGGAPWLNYLLSMSNLRMRDYMVGSALGLAPHQLALCAVFWWAVVR